MRTVAPLLAVPLALMTLAAAAGECRGQAAFTGLGHLPGAGAGKWTSATAVDSSGGVVVGAGAGACGATTAFVWRVGVGMAALEETCEPAEGSAARGVSGDGAVIVGSYYNGANLAAVRWTDGGPADAIPGMREARGVSLDGTRIVGIKDGTRVEAALWTDSEGLLPLGVLAETLPPPGPWSGAQCISPDGLLVAGSSNSPSGEQAFRWSVGAGMVGLGDLPGSEFRSVANACSEHVVVGWGVPDGSSNGHAARWTAAGGWQPLPYLFEGQHHGWANGVSADGLRIVGTTSETIGGFVAVVWDQDEQPIRLADALDAHGVSTAGWTLREATAISGDGRTIVGVGTNPNGETEAFRAVLPRICRADFDRSGTLGVNDIFAFLTVWFTGEVIGANYNRDCCVNVGDIFAFLNDWFAGCE